MIIEFPKKYQVRHMFAEVFNISVPPELRDEAKALFVKQKWVEYCELWGSGILILQTSRAYEATIEEYGEALRKLCDTLFDDMDESIKDELRSIVD